MTPAVEDALRAAGSAVSAAGVEADLAVAMARARSAYEWSRFDCELGDDAIRRAVDRAPAATGGDDGSRERVSYGYKVWLGDDAAAAAFGARGQRPEAFWIRSHGATGWSASASGLFDWLRARATDDTFVRIARAPLGNQDHEDLVAIRDICATGLVPRRLNPGPHEALALTRWPEGEGVDHIARGLSCVLLCISTSSLSSFYDNSIVLLDSCLALGAEASDHAAAFFAWLAESHDASCADHDAIPAKLLLLLVAAAGSLQDERFGSLALAIAWEVDPPAGRVADYIACSMRAAWWREQIERMLFPLRDAQPSIAAMLSSLAPLWASQ